MKEDDLTRLLNSALQAVQLASAEVMKLYHSQDFTSYVKTDKTGLVTTADLVANEVICHYLSSDSIWPILSEENRDNASRLQEECVWLVDPLDGTKEFLSRNGEFSINVALVMAGRPIIGVVAHPVENTVYYAAKDQGAYLLRNSQNKKQLRVATKQHLTDLTIRVSRSHVHPELMVQLSTLKTCELIAQGSALKYCAVASGGADATLRRTPLHEWDIAAADCILQEAGGIMTTLSGELFIYNASPQTLIESGVVASNKLLHPALLKLIRVE